MKKSPGDVYDAYAPDYLSDVQESKNLSPVTKTIVSKIQKVLIIGRDKVDYCCLPVESTETSDAFIPVGNKGYANPLLMYRLAHANFRAYFGTIKTVDISDIQEYVGSLYGQLLKGGCRQISWAHVPTSEFVQQSFIIKARPVVHIKKDLYLQGMTNQGRYIRPGHVMHFGSRPCIVDTIPLFLPKHFLCDSFLTAIPTSDRDAICVESQKHFSDIYTLYL